MIRRPTLRLPLATYAALAVLVLGSLGHSPSASAQEWGKVGFISSTLGNTLNRVCVGAPSALRPGDLGCSSNAPYVSPTSGYLGIGTTGPSYPLDVSGILNLGGPGNPTLRLNHAHHYIERSGTTNNYYSSGSHVMNGTAGPIARFIVSSLTSNFYGGITTGSYATIAPPSLGAIIQGNVGIATSAPSNTLHVSGTARFTSWTAIAANVTPTVELDVYGTISATNLLVNGVAVGGVPDRITSGTTNITATNNQSITFTTAGSQRMVLDERGYLGVGTSALSSTLHIYGTSTASRNFANSDALGAGLVIQSSAVGSDSGGEILFASPHGSFAGIKGALRNGTGPAGDLVFQTRGTSGNILERMTVRWNGQVGIGTSDPRATLQVSGSFVVSTSAQVTTPSLYVGTNGNVGIGTSAPEANLHIAATDYASLRLTDGDIALSNNEISSPRCPAWADGRSECGLILLAEHRLT